MTDLSPFHLAIPVKDLDETLAFYEELLQCSRGRESGDWVDLNFLGHQLVLHRVERAAGDEIDTNPVDGEYVPVPHFGVVLDWDVFESMSALSGRNMYFRFGKMEIPFTTDNFLATFSKPNLYFHATTTYTVLRQLGTPLGKLDFMGNMKVGH